MIAKCLRIFLLGFIAGVGLGSVFLAPRYFYFIAAGTIAALLLMSLFTRRALLIVCVVMGASFGVWYISRTFTPNQFVEQFGSSIDAEGIISVEPEVVAQNQSLTIRLDNYDQELRAFVYQPTLAHLGDRVWVRGVLELPKDFDNFDYVGYLQRYNVYANLKKPRIIVLKPIGTTWRTPFYQLRRYLLKEVTSRFAPEPGSLIAGMLIGYRKSMSDETTETFRKTGLMHVVAVSGFNMTILASACMVMSSYIGRKAAGIATILSIFCFVMIAGMSASVIRSAVMALLLVAAQFSGRLYNSRHALILTAGIMVMLNPRIVLWDVGFQLSVVATAGVLYAYELRVDSESNSASLSFIWPSLGAIIATAPLVAFHFQTLSLVALPANLLLLPLVPWIMLFGALSFAPLIGSGFGLIASMLAGLMLHAVKWLALVPYSSVNFEPSAQVVLACYGALFLIVQFVLFRRHNQVLPKVKNYDKL